MATTSTPHQSPDIPPEDDAFPHITPDMAERDIVRRSIPEMQNYVRKALPITRAIEDEEVRIGDEGNESGPERRRRERYGFYPTSMSDIDRAEIEDRRRGAWERIRQYLGREDFHGHYELMQWAKKHNRRIRMLRCGPEGEEMKEIADERSDFTEFPEGGSATVDPRGYVIIHDELGKIVNLESLSFGEEYPEFSTN